MMKKMFVLLLVVMLVLGLVACGGGSNGGGAGASNPVADFLAEYGDELSEEFEMIMGGGGSIELTAGSGNEMIFTFRFDETLGEEGIEMMFDMIGSTFEFLAGELAEEIGVDSLRLTVHFHDAEGNTGRQSFDS